MNTTSNTTSLLEKSDRSQKTSQTYKDAYHIGLSQLDKHPAKHADFVSVADKVQNMLERSGALQIKSKTPTVPPVLSNYPKLLELIDEYFAKSKIQHNTPSLVNKIKNIANLVYPNDDLSSAFDSEDFYNYILSRQPKCEEKKVSLLEENENNLAQNSKLITEDGVNYQNMLG